LHSIKIFDFDLAIKMSTIFAQNECPSNEAEVHFLDNKIVNEQPKD